MKIAVLSDTHGNYALAVKTLEGIPDIDCIIHLGDTLADAEIIECALECPTIKIAGNCDTDHDAPKEVLLTLQDIVLFATHGDSYGVKADLERLRRKAALLNTQTVLYGHTHSAGISRENGILCINPGCLKRTAEHLSYALLTIERGTVTAEIISIPSETP